MESGLPEDFERLNLVKGCDCHRMQVQCYLVAKSNRTVRTASVACCEQRVESNYA